MASLWRQYMRSVPGPHIRVFHSGTTLQWIKENWTVILRDTLEKWSKLNPWFRHAQRGSVWYLILHWILKASPGFYIYRTLFWAGSLLASVQGTWELSAPLNLLNSECWETKFLDYHSDGTPFILLFSCFAVMLYISSPVVCIILFFMPNSLWGLHCWVWGVIGQSIYLTYFSSCETWLSTGC